VVEKYIKMYSNGIITEHELLYQLSEVCVLKENIQVSVVAGSEEPLPGGIVSPGEDCRTNEK